MAIVDSFAVFAGLSNAGKPALQAAATGWCAAAFQERLQSAEIRQHKEEFDVEPHFLLSGVSI